MAYTTIDNPAEYFNTVLYTGNGTDDTTISGVGFQSDLTWIKGRSNTAWHQITDSVRGAGNVISTNSTGAESNFSSIKSWNSDGFVLSDNANFNGNTVTFVSWNWKAGGGSGSSNEDGGINTTSTSVNQTAGFSISTWTGTGSNATVGHGLNAVPKFITTKARSHTYDWYTYHASIGNTKNIYLDKTNAASSASANFHNNTDPTSSVWTAGGNIYNDTYTFVTYAFADVQGFSKVGSSYTGNGNANGPFVYTGFRPAFVMLKKSSDTGNWLMYDTKREGYNVDNDALLANTSDAEETDDRIDILSNGFKLRGSQTANNASGATYIYVAFAEAPFVNSKGVPCNAR